VTELNYHPAKPTSAELTANPALTREDFEFVELRNSGPGVLDLTGVSFVKGITFTFLPSHGFLSAGTMIILAKNPAAYALRYPTSQVPAGTYSGSLSNSGESLTLAAADGSFIFDFRYRDSWSPVTDGDGYSLNLLDASPPHATYDLPAAWSPGFPSPGTINRTTFVSDFVHWQQLHFPEADLANPASGGRDADPDADGCSNFLEFALLSDPLASHSIPAITLLREAGNLRMLFQRPVSPVGVTYQIEISSDLKRWDPLPNAMTILPTETGMAENISLTLLLPASDQCWFRVRVTGS